MPSHRRAGASWRCGDYHSPAMATEQLLQAEARERPRIAVVAALAALFTLASPLVGLVALKGSPDNLPGAVLFRHEHELALGIGAACSVLGLVAVVLVLDFLARAALARSPQAPRWMRPLAFAGGLGLAAVSVAIQISGIVQLAHFATHGSQTYEEARKATNFGALAYVGLLAQLAFVAAIVTVSINAMRVGLLTRFLGYLGVISAVLFVLPFLPLPVVQIYWLGALAVLLAGWTPSGTPAAWSSGEAVAWPSAQELREQRVRAGEARRGGTGAGPAEAEEAAAASAGPARRKRKKRR